MVKSLQFSFFKIYLLKWKSIMFTIVDSQNTVVEIEDTINITLSIFSIKEN